MTQASLPPNSALLKSQMQFTQHLRNPDAVPVPAGLDKRRMGIYTGLIFHNISALMMDFYPVIYSITPKADWDALIREFFINYRAETPYFPKLADEFLQFLMQRPGTNHEPEYLVPLAHYEWLELCLFTSESELFDTPLSDTELRTEKVSLTELAIPVAYDFPVHQIRENWDQEKRATAILLFRDKSDSVRFFELQPLAFELLSNMQLEGGLHIVNWLATKAHALKQPDEKAFIDFGFKLVQQFNEENLLTCSPKIG